MNDAGSSLAANPIVSQWLEFLPPGQVVVKVGKVELGQGITTALAQIAADELDVAWERVRMVPTTTRTSPDEQFTSGSLSLMTSGSALRHVCATVRRRLLETASDRSGTPLGDLRVTDGGVYDAQGRLLTTYWRLAADGLVPHDVDPRAAVKSPSTYQIVGRSVPRLDLPDKLSGRPGFIHDLALPGLLFGRVVRPPAPGARLLTVDQRRAQELPAVTRVVRNGSFLAVIATREEEAVRAAELLRASAKWRLRGDLPDPGQLREFLTSQGTDDTVLTRTSGADGRRAATWMEHSYSRPYIAHASIGPGCAVAIWEDEAVTVWSHSQGVFPLREAIAEACGLAPNQVIVHHAQGAGCYGHNGADDVAFDSVLLARAVPGRPVQVVSSREDEFAWEPYGPAMAVDLRIGVDDAGDPTHWYTQVWGGGHHARPGYAGAPGLLATWHETDVDPWPPAEDPSVSVGGGNARNALPAYDIPQCEVVSHRLLSMPLRTSSLRSLGAMMNVFAIESAMDELAERAGTDPIDYRLRHLDDERARAVIEAVARRASWRHRERQESVGWGVAFARYKNRSAYCAVVARVEAFAEVKVRNLYVAVDAGQVVNPDGLANQIEGGAIQATSWTVREEVRFDRERVTSRDWESYPILRFSDVPSVEVEILSRVGDPPLGAGECAPGPVSAAIANALYDAVGVRVRDLPLTPERVRAAILE